MIALGGTRKPVAGIVACSAFDEGCDEHKPILFPENQAKAVLPTNLCTKR